MPINSSKTVVEIDADNAKYLKAVQQMRREEEKAEKARDLAIAKTLAAQGKLTEETFNAAKAAGVHADAFGEIEKQASIAGKAVELLGGRVKAMGMSILSGFGAGIVGGVLGGSVQSLISKAFEPPTDAELDQWAKLGDTITGITEDTFGYKKALVEYAQATKDADRQAALDKAGLALLGDTLEDITHSNAIEQIENALENLSTQMQNGVPDVDGYRKAFAKLNDELDHLKGHQTAAEVEAAKNQALTEGLKSAGARFPYDPRTNPYGWKAAVGGGGGSSLSGFGPKPTDTLFGRGVDYLQLVASRQEANQIAASRAMAGDMFKGFDAGQATRDLDDIYKAFDKVRQAGADAANDKLAAYNAQSPLEKIFGTSEQMQSLASAFGGFADAVGESYTAIVTGSEGAGRAFARFLSGSLIGIGRKAQVQAIYEVALAISEPWDAGRHLLAAAKFEATAIAAGVAASALGAGAGGGASAGAAPTGSYGTYAGSPGGGGMTFVYGDSFADDSPRMRARKAAQLIRRAQRDGGYGDTNDDVRYR